MTNKIKAKKGKKGAILRKKKRSKFKVVSTKQKSDKAKYGDQVDQEGFDVDG